MEPGGASRPVSVLNWGYPPVSSRLAMATTFARWYPRQANTNSQHRHSAG